MFASKSQNGFTLVESLIGISVFVIIAVSVYQAYVVTMRTIEASRLKVAAAALANEQFEIIRNLPYADVGIPDGIPDGKIPHIQTLTRDGNEFTVETTIRNIDDPFDGTIDGNPSDLSPSDYKLVELEIGCTLCKNFTPLSFTTQVGPRALETSSTNGALFVQVFDAAGQPVIDADVHVENNQGTSSIVIDDSTNNNGMLQIVDAPPGFEAYEITVSKSGYSTDQTYLPGDAENPNPVKPHATVATQQLTQISFAIDRTSDLSVSSMTDTCTPVPSIGFSLFGSKLIGTDPEVLKYDASFSTDAAGNRNIANLEWDTYNVDFTDSVYDLAGTIPLFPLTLNPDSEQNVQFIVAPKNPRTLLVTVKDASTQLPLTDATVRLERIGYDETLTTGQGFIRQTDWSGGSGQEDFISTNEYFDSNGDIRVNDPAGEFHLRQILDEYQTPGWLISSTFDVGSSSANFHQILWQPQDQPPPTGENSVRFQIATNNDKLSWNFVGPDGTSASYYTAADQNINALHDGSRYLRYKAYLQTASTTWTPTISDISFTFTSSCVPPGQALFSGLGAGTYTLTVSKSGYEQFTDTISMDASWQQRDVTLSP